MSLRQERVVLCQDYTKTAERFLAEVLNGLGKPQKELPSKYFYDERGSRLFERICHLGEYYIPRTEASIMNSNIDGIVELIGSDVQLIEYGSGDCAKVRLLLDHLHDIGAYVPIDISQNQLLRVTRDLASQYPELEILPVCADYTGYFELPAPERRCNRKVVYFPGSTIGNFDPIPARNFLEHIAGVCGSGGGLLIGVDLKKDPRLLHNAYNDAEGITAAFNLNLLHRINFELNADFQLEGFEHYAFYNPAEGRVEMHLVSLAQQTVHIADHMVFFEQGESIWTESSYKYSLEEFERLAGMAGFKVEKVWMDANRWFSVQYLIADH